MFGMIGKIICAGLSVLCFGYSGMCLFTNTDKKAASIIEVADCNVHPENEGKLVMLRGKLTYNNTITEDPELGVRIKAPILKRHTEMYQYYPDSTSSQKKDMRMGWKTNGVASFEDRYKHHYSNPTFPSDIPRGKDFASDITVNNGNLKVDAEYVKVLSYGKYVTFKDTYTSNMKTVTNLPSKKVPKGFVNTGKSYYKPYDGSDVLFLDKFRAGRRSNKVGDIRIYYTAYKWTDDLPEFTVIGLQENGKILKKEGSLFYDYRIENQEQLAREVRTNNRSAMFGALFCGAILAALALFI